MSISSVTSEALQAKLRQLLPSQQGFGTDISASDTIVPIIDLTEAAEGSAVGLNLQTAIAFGSQTEVIAANATVVAANTPGFYRLIGVACVEPNSGVQNGVTITLDDGATTKEVWGQQIVNTTPQNVTTQQVDLTFFLGSGESLSVVSTRVDARFVGSVRQVATSNGTLVNPVGFTPQ